MFAIECGPVESKVLDLQTVDSTILLVLATTIVSDSSQKMKHLPSKL